MKIYKTDTKGNTRYLDVYSEGDEVIQISGIIDTENPVEHRKTCKPKNVGKSNETTAKRQAELEAKAIIADKLTKGYFEDIKSLKTEKVILPMLAKDYKKESKKIDWSKDVYVQPKLDGMRCLILVDEGGITLKSRDGKLITTMLHIENDILNNGFFFGYYDGELYSHGRTFQENMELIKKIRPETKEIKFHCYDVVSDYPFRDRLIEIFDGIGNCNNIVPVDTYEIKNEDDLKEYHQKFLSEGYEGTMVRHSQEGYKVNGRSSNLLKYKDFQDIALMVIDIVPAEQRPEWGVPIVNYNGKEVRCGVKLSHEQRVEILKNKEEYIGAMGEIRYFEETDEGSLRFPVLHGFRLDK